MSDRNNRGRESIATDTANGNEEAADNPVQATASVYGDNGDAEVFCCVIHQNNQMREFRIWNVEDYLSPRDIGGELITYAFGCGAQEVFLLNELMPLEDLIDGVRIYRVETHSTEQAHPWEEHARNGTPTQTKISPRGCCRIKQVGTTRKGKDI